MEKTQINNLYTHIYIYTDIVCVVKIWITTLQRVARCLVFCVVFCRSLSFWPFSFDHWVVCPSPIYGFWLSLWYHETFLKYNGSFLQLLKKWQSDWFIFTINAIDRSYPCWYHRTNQTRYTCRHLCWYHTYTSTM
jgi:hypothetical protein